nr:diphtheria toxin-granulocyte colony stimulating factor fusion protein [synthetic construct]
MHHHHHHGADDVVDSSKSFVMENFSSYHGTKPGYVDSIQKGIQKPKSGTQGNYDDDWKGFYSTDNKYDAAGYSVDNENPLSGKAGGVVKVTYPGLTKVLALKVDNAETIKKELGLSLTEPLMEQVGTEEFIKRFGDGASRVVLSLPFAEGSSSVEYINNWEQAKALSVELEINFETRGKRGQDAMYEYMAQACAGNRVRRSVGSSLSCINLDWDVIRDKTKTKIESLKEHGPIKNKMSESPNKTVSEEKAKQYLEEFHQTALEHPELSELKTVTGTNPVFAGANYAAWAVNVAQVIDSETADNLEKTTAALSILPGIGSVMGIADGAVHHNTEEIVAQSIALSSLMVAQAIPLVGELVDIGFAAYNFVESIINLFQVVHNSYNRPAYSPGHKTSGGGGSMTPLGPASSLPQSFLLKCLEQVRKIQGDGAALQEKLCATYKLCHPEELVLLGHSLGIPWAPLSSCPSQALQLAGCLSQLHSGLFLYQGLLQALEGISPELGPTLDTLQLDVADFATTIWQQMEELGMAPALQPTQGAMPAFASAFQRRAGGVLVASHLQSFLEVSYRVLRHLAQP